MAAKGTKAHVVVCALPFLSHFIPMQTISRNLLARGYQVTFITGEGFREQVEETGAKCVVPSGWQLFNDDSASKFAFQQKSRSFIERENANTTEFFIKHIPVQFHAIQAILAAAEIEYPTKPVVLLPESSFLGGLPYGLGAPGLRPSGVVSIGILPILALSVDTAPPGLSILPDSSEGGRRRNAGLNEEFVHAFGPSQTELNKVLEKLGARTTELYRHNATLEKSDFFLQLCPPCLEYPRSDAPLTLEFTGGLPRHDAKSSNPSDLPIWWNELVGNPNKKKIVAVSQGTVARNYQNLIMTTLEALKSREDIMVVVALGKKGATLPATAVIPANARISDWIPFDELFSLSDVFVTNGGYGSFQNALHRGVPLVIAAPQFADKTDIADRVEWSGTGINLKTGTPDPEVLKEAIMEVLTEEKYKKKALEVQAEIESYEPMGVITAAIDKTAGL